MTYKPFYDHVLYDGVNLSDHFDINVINPDPMPEMEAVTTKIPGKAGLHFCSRDIGQRTITLDLSVKGFKRDPFLVSNAWSLVAKYLLKDEPKPLALGDGREINALPLSAGELRRLGKRGVSTVTFTAFDPFFYGQEYEIKLKTGSNTFYVYGDYEVYPVIELTGTSGAISLTNNATGEVVRIPSVGNSTAKVVIDMGKMKCTRNGDYLAVDLGVSEFYSLQPGDVDLRLSAGSGTLKYREVTL